MRNLVIGITLFLPVKTFAQLSASDSTIYQIALRNVIGLYHQSSGDQSGLYNGTEYTGYPFLFKGGHPFFFSDVQDTGSIVYDGIFYERVPLLYDEVSDVVIMRGNGTKMQFVSEKVNRFAINNNQFIRVVKDSTASASLNTGFYNLLYEGKTSLLKKEVKSIREEIKSLEEGIQRFIDVNRYYYVRRGNVFLPVKRKSDVLKVFGERKAEVRQYIKSNKLNFRKNRDRMLTQVTAYFDNLTK